MIRWKILGFVLAGLLTTTGAFAGGAYAADVRLEATIVEKQCAGSAPAEMPGNETAPQDPDPGSKPPSAEGDSEPKVPDPAAQLGGANSTVTIRTKALSVEHTVTGFDDQKCWVLRAGEDGNFIVYHLRTERAQFYEREGGVCLYDTEYGPGCVLGSVLAAMASNAEARSAFALSTSGYVREPLGAVPHTAPNCVTFTQDVRAIDVVASWVAADPTHDRLRLVAWATDSQGNELDRRHEEGATGLSLSFEVPADAVSWTVAVAPEGSAPLAVGTAPSVAIELTAHGLPHVDVPEPRSCRV